MTKTVSKHSQLNIIFYDGICVLCNGLVTWLIQKDTHKQFHFMKHKYEQRTEHTLEKDDRFYFYFDQFDREISLNFHSARNDVTEYSMSLDKFIKSLQISISDFDKNELEVMKTLAAVLFTKIREIEKAEAEAELEETEEKVTQTV